MTSTSLTGDISALQSQFARNATATPPHKTMAAAEGFIQYVAKMQEAGLMPANAAQDATALHDKLHQDATLYEYHAALNAPECPHEMNNHFNEVKTQIGIVSDITQRLRVTMKATA